MRVPSTDGVTVAVHDLGGDGEPFLISHATGMHGQAYGAMAVPISRHHHVYALDYRGHGDTDAPTNGRFDWNAMADDLEAVIKELTSAPVAVFGHSMGGAVAMILERRRPGTLRSAYLYEPIMRPIDVQFEGANPMSEAARRRRPSFPSKAAALMRYASRPPLNVWQAGALADYVQYGFRDEPDGTVALKCSPEHEAATFEATGKPTLDVAAAVQTPTAVAIGIVEGEFSPARFGPMIVEAMPNAVLEEHPNLGHFGPLQDPAAIAAAILGRE